MSAAWRAVLRSAVIIGAVVVTVASVLSLEPADWPIYLVFVLISAALYLPYVEVLPGMPLPVPEMAAAIGFLYVGGPLVIALSNIAPLLAGLLRRTLPERWKENGPGPRAGAGVARRQLFGLGWRPELPATAGLAANLATFTLGLGTRWGIVTALVPEGLHAPGPAAIAVAELGGYACWGLLSILPIYPDRPLLTFSSEGGLRTALADIGLVIALALTPFVFLISYGFQAHGLSGAAVWSVSALGLHFMLKRLNERRVTVEEQNRRLESLNRELEHRERLSAIGKMSSVVSHQILHQLGVIGIYADLIRHSDDKGDPATVLDQAHRNALAIEGALCDVNRVLTDLLVFSKDLRLNLYEHPLGRVIGECIEDCRAEAAERGVTLRLECEVEVQVVLDKLKMKQAMVNVLRNAIEASTPGNKVVTRVVSQDGSVDVRVSDQGPGVPERDREAVFTPFFTTKEHGTGLGLAIAREFTEAHGGRLWVESPSERPGATFIFRLPTQPA